jgi:hypothetical protein
VRGLPAGSDPRLLVGAATGDEAAVFQVREGLALVQTIDFFTPIVDDPFDFGRIAAADALSDVYAMGGRPLAAPNLVAFPLEQLGPEVLSQILRGGLAVAEQAGCVIVGGHSIDDSEPKYGLAVTGTVEPDRMLDQRRSPARGCAGVDQGVSPSDLSGSRRENRLRSHPLRPLDLGESGDAVAEAGVRPQKDRIGTSRPRWIERRVARSRRGPEVQRRLADGSLAGVIATMPHRRRRPVLPLRHRAGLRGVPGEIEPLEAVDRLLDERRLAAHNAERTQRERLDVRARLEQ